MERLTGEKLLKKLEDLRDARADIILTLTGYLSKFGYIKDERERTEFCQEFYWAYVNKYGFPAKLVDKKYYAKTPDEISPKNLILLLID